MGPAHQGQVPPRCSCTCTRGEYRHWRLLPPSMAAVRKSFPEQPPSRSSFPPAPAGSARQITAWEGPGEALSASCREGCDESLANKTRLGKHSGAFSARCSPESRQRAPLRGVSPPSGLAGAVGSRRHNTAWFCSWLVVDPLCGSPPPVGGPLPLGPVTGQQEQTCSRSEGPREK